jgi:hypothetical protein
MANRYWVGGSGTWNAANTANWSTASGGAGGASVPTTTDAAFFDAASGGGTITLGQDVVAQRVVGSGFTGNMDWNTYKILIGGNGTIVWSTGGLVPTGASEPKVELTYSGATGTRIVSQSQTAEENTISFYISAGTDIVRFDSGTARAYRNVDFTGFSGSWTSSNSNNVWNIYGSLTLSSTMTMPPSQTGGIVMLGTTGTKTVTTNGKTFNQPVAVNATANTIKFVDALNCTTFTLSNGAAEFEAGTTNIATTFVISGGQIKSSVSGTQFTLSQTSGTINAANATIADSNVTGGASWNAYVDFGNIDAGNNDGWNFGLSPGYESFEPPIKLRSFTQPRRF